MSKIDELINETLSEEDEALLDHFNSEPGYFAQAFALFTGRLGWVMWSVMIVQILMFVGAIWAVWAAFTTPETLAAVRWGVIAVILVQIGTFLRGFMGDHFEANRVLREVRRLELRLVQRDSTGRE